MKGSKRAQALAEIRAAGYHDQIEKVVDLTGIRGINAERVRYEYEAGKRMRAQGIQCTCKDCLQ